MKDYIGFAIIIMLALAGVVFSIGQVMITDAKLAGVAACAAICNDDGAEPVGGEKRVVKCLCPKEGGAKEIRAGQAAEKAP